MSNKKIFIAGAYESNKIAIEIAIKLEDAKYVPVSWWNSFEPGEYTLAKLRTIAGTVIY